MKCLAALFSAVCSFAALAHAAPRPNVILFLVDDMGWMDCGAYGSKYYETPNIDRFATRAMRFTDAYTQPLCSPTRASILTGKYSARHGITSATGHLPPQPAGFQYLPATAPANAPMCTPASRNYLDPAEYTLAEALRDAGYRTAHIGKWHLGLTRPHWPEAQGFDVAFHCHPDPGPPGGYFSPYGVKAEGEPRGQTRVGTITDGPAGEYIVDRQAAEAEKFIAENRERPFFLNLWCYGVHGPWGHKEEYTRAFAGKKDPRGQQGNPIMASMLRSVDECFGRILAAVEKHGLTEQTIVIFFSDNGGNTHSNVPATGKTARAEKNKSESLADWRKWAGDLPPTNNTPLRDGKASLYEGGTRVPLMWSWPGKIRAGTTNDSVVGHIDLYATVLELTGIAKPAQQQWDGVSYANVLQSTGSLQRDAFFNYFPHGKSPGQAGGVWVRAGEWKLLRWFGAPAGSGERLELYNLRADLGETTNLAVKEAERVRAMDAQIDAFLASTGATFPQPNPACKMASVAAPKAKNADDPLEGWKARQCEAVVKDGVVTVTPSGQRGPAFLGHAMGKTNGPAVLTFRARSSAGGAGKVEWLPGGQAGGGKDAQEVSFEFAAGDWREQAVRISAQGPLGTMRLYLPAPNAPMELDWIELRPAAGKGTRWDFAAP